MPGTRPGMTAWTQTMHDIHAIRQNPVAFDQMLGRRNLADEDRRRFSSDQIISIDERRRAIIRVREEVLARRNALSKEIGLAKAKNDEAAFRQLMAQVENDRASISRMEDEQKTAENELNNLLAQIPNLPLDEVPDGKDEKDNVEHHRFGAKHEYAFVPKEHFYLGEALGQMDFETAAKLSGARFVVLKKGLARLERALGQFMLDVQTSEPHNYWEVSPPLLVRDEAMFGTAQLPKFSNDQWRGETEDAQRRHAYENFEQAREVIIDYVAVRGVEAAKKEKLEVLGFVYEPTPDRRWLIPTAEVPLTNLVRE